MTDRENILRVLLQQPFGTITWKHEVNFDSTLEKSSLLLEMVLDIEVTRFACMYLYTYVDSTFTRSYGNWSCHMSTFAKDFRVSVQ